MTTTYTRTQYLQNECTHREYYGQFVTPNIITIVVNSIGAERILASRDQHLNDIPLALWDRLSVGYSAAKLRALGDYPTLAGDVCIAKEAARQFIEQQGE